MNLEVNLVRVSSVGAKMGTLLARNRYLVTNDTEALGAIAKFIADNESTFNLKLTDQRLVAQLSSLDKMTITDFICLRTIISSGSTGLDLWVNYVADVEANPKDIPDGVSEYNIVDSANMMSAFIPFATKMVQPENELDLLAVYKKSIEMFGLYSSPIFSGINAPLISAVKTLESFQKPLGPAGYPTMITTAINSYFEALKKEFYVITH